MEENIPSALEIFKGKIIVSFFENKCPMKAFSLFSKNKTFKNISYSRFITIFRPKSVELIVTIKIQLKKIFLISNSILKIVLMVIFLSVFFINNDKFFFFKFMSLYQITWLNKTSKMKMEKFIKKAAFLN